MSALNVYFDDDNYIELKRSNGHFYLSVPIVRVGSNLDEHINFILDTGAYITVISRRTAKRCGYDKIKPSGIVQLSGFTGSEPADLIEIPAMKIGGKVLLGVKVLIPHRPEFHAEVLGQNVLEYFEYYLNTGNDRIYFKENLSPKPYDKLLSSKIFNTQEID